MRDRLNRFMMGRYGVDELSRTLNVAIIVCFVISLIGGRIAFLGIFYWLGLILMIYNIFRMFSRNTSKRYSENQRFCSARYRFNIRFGQWKKHMSERRIYRFYKCPACSQKVRVPKGRGKIRITCPRCRQEFVKRS
jgi:DNA-directed RNA polymerase subunit RPC12/RpoP